MKPLYIKDILNYEYPVQALNAATSQDCSAEGFFAEDLCRDFYGWRSDTKDQIDIYFEISEEDGLTTFALMQTNLSNKAQVYLSASNTSGIGAFYAPIYTRSLARKNNNWIVHSNGPLASARYYKLTIIENEDTETEYIEIARIICGIAQEFAIDLVDGFTNGKESFQKRETQAGQWRPGSENSMLNIFYIEFAPIFGNRSVKNHDYAKIYAMNNFIEEMRTSKPFLFILNPHQAEQLFEYVTIDGDTIDITYEENGTTLYSFSLKELK